jgi:hypothetical protein
MLEDSYSNTLQRQNFNKFEILKGAPSESTFSRFETKTSKLELQKELGNICETL